MRVAREYALWFRLAHTPGLPARVVRRVLAGLGSIDAVGLATASELRAWLDDDQLRAWINPSPELLKNCEATLVWVDQAPAGVRHVLVALGDPLYPEPLLHLSDPPLLLHACISEKCLVQLGTQGLQGQWASRTFAVVGSRNATPQGGHNAHNVSMALCERGWTIVSGLASGIDAAAHTGALDAKGGAVLPTMAVVGTGLDRVYPRQNAALFERIQSEGVVWSEHPLGTPPMAAHFPRRNRLIAAFGLGTLVVEAAPLSGSLITAKLAAELGREVFAIPGSIHQTGSKGCHALIRQGAVLVETVADILNEFPASIPGSTRQPESAQAVASDQPLLPSHLALLDAMGADPVGVEVLCERLQRSAQEVQTQLFELELEQMVATLPGGLVQRVWG